ncbi:YncE family protein [Deferrisoma palaeochoriense]
MWHTIQRSAMFLAAACLLLAGCGGSSGGSDTAAPALPGSVFVTTTDFTTGGYATIDLDTLEVQAFEGNGIVESDNAVASHGGKIYVINRMGFDNVTVLDPSDLTVPVAQYSTGNGTNPHAMAFASDAKAFVSLYGADHLLIVNPATGEEVGRVDLSGFADDDGLPEASAMAVVGGKLFVALQRLDRDSWFAPTDASYLVVIDTATDQIVDVDPSTPGTADPIVLTGTNPQFMVYDETLGKIVVSETGSYGAQDGGLEAVDPNTYAAEGFLVTEADLGGDVGALAVVDGSKAYVVVTDSSWANDVAVVERIGIGGAWEKQGTLGLPGAFIPNLALDGRGRLLVPDRDTTRPGVRVYDTATDQEVEGSPVDVGLPPNAIAVF